MNVQTITSLQKIREKIWKIQDTLEKEISIAETHRMLGDLANDVMRYQYEELKNSNSQEELFAKLDSLIKNSNEKIQFFTDLKRNLQVLSSGNPLDSSDEYEKNLENTARELLSKFIS